MSKAVRIRAILFDKDGTLLDFGATWFAVGDAMALAAAGGDRARADALLTRAGYDFEQRCFLPDSVFAAGTNADIVALWYPDADAQRRRELVETFDRLTTAEGALRSVPIEGMRAALTRLHAAGLRLGLATNDSTGGAEKALLALGIAQLFDAVYGYDGVANPKPAPDTVHAFADLTGLKPSQIAVVGDNRHDLEMAKAGGAGLAIGVLSGTGTSPSLAPLADVIIGSVAELPDLLAKRASANA